MVTEEGISKSEAFRKMTDIYRTIGIEIGESTVRSKYYRGEGVANATTQADHTKQAETITIKTREGTAIEENTAVDERPICRLCHQNLVEFTSHTKKPATSGLCQICSRKETSKKKNNPPQATLNEPKIDPDQQAAWEEVDRRILELVEFICGRTRSPMIIPDSLRGSLKDSLSRLDSLLRGYLY